MSRHILSKMRPTTINLDEEIGKTVGKMASAENSYARLAATAESMVPRLPYPKGVYRFRTFEEADAWTEQHILRAARKKSQDRLG